MTSPAGSAETRLAALMERLLAAAEAALAAGDLEIARATAEDVRTVEPDNERAAQILARVLVAQRAPAGERALMTLLFSDLVDSTSMAERLEPEAMRDIFDRYRGESHVAVERYGGQVVKYLGDGVLAGFGYPQAHEDDARRCVLAGLDLVAAMDRARDELTAQHGAAPEVRVGIHTGRVVIADLGSGVAREHDSIVGAATNLAARIQAAASPGTVVVSDVTYTLVENDFDVRPLGVHDLKGITREVELYEVTTSRSVVDRLDAVRYRLASLVGRDAAASELFGAWDQVRNAGSTATRGASFLVVGEAGIGKSRLAADLRRRVAGTAGDTLATGCAPYYANVSLWPLERLMERALDLHTDVAADRLGTLVDHASSLGMNVARAVPMLAPLLGAEDPGRYPEPQLDPVALRQERLGCVADWLLRLAVDTPRLLLVEDLHWADPSTIDLLGGIAAEPPPGMLTVMTTRSDGLLGWAGAVPTIPLGRLDDTDALRLVDELDEEMRLDDGRRRSIVERAEGIPLFLEELTRSALAAGDEPLPMRLQELLAGRLKAGDVDLRLAQVAATVGATFTAETVGSVIGDIEGAQASLTGLEAAGIIEPEGDTGSGTYHFRHALMRDAAYETQMLEVRTATHDKVAGVLRDGGADSAIVAHHYDQAGDPARAIQHYFAAVQESQRSGAHAEAIQLVSRALDIVAELPEGEERDVAEVSARMMRVLSLSSTQGYAAPGIQDDQRRAEALTQRLGHRPEVTLPVLNAIWAYWLTNGDLATASQLLDRMVAIVADDRQAWFRPEVEACVGFQSFYEGRLAEAMRHLDLAATGFHTRPENQTVSPLWPLPNDPYAVTAVAIACVATLQGDLEEAARWEAEAAARAEACGFPQGPFSLAFVKTYSAWNRRIVGDAEGAQALGMEVIGIGKEYGYAYWLALGAMYLAAGEPGAPPDPESLSQAITMLRAIGHHAFVASALGYVAELWAAAGEVPKAQATVAEAVLLAEKTGERLHLPELLRIRAELESGDPAAAAVDLADAIALATEQEAWLMALRCAVAEAGLPAHVRPRGWRDTLEAALARMPAGARLADVARAETLLGR